MNEAFVSLPPAYSSATSRPPQKRSRTSLKPLSFVPHLRQQKLKSRISSSAALPFAAPPPPIEPTRTPSRPSSSSTPAAVKQIFRLDRLLCHEDREAKLDKMRREVTQLAASRGAMGRGVRACLRAFYRRAGHIVAANSNSLRLVGSTRDGNNNNNRDHSDAVYVECGPAYVLASAAVGYSKEKVTRYAVEHHAWPALRSVMNWEEVPLHTARSRGARLRALHPGGRYGRHLFFERDVLAIAAQVAEDYFDDVATEVKEASEALNEPWVGGSDVEAVISLRRMPLPGTRTVSARCPRGDSHRNGDRKPSLMLWMNRDGVTGGAMCPVCTESTENKDSPQKFLTWRVLYMQDNRAALCTPRKRAHLALAEMCIGSGDAAANAIAAACAEKEQEPGENDEFTTSDTVGDANGNVNINANSPVGGYVIQNRSEATRVGRAQNMVYVTAILKGSLDEDEGRKRSVGTAASQCDPIQALLWSDRRARGPMAEERARETAWFARANLDTDDDENDNNSTNGLHDDWLPTPVLSISAMKPTEWREVSAPNGRIVRVPASWEPTAQAWILFDLDDLYNITDDNVGKIAQKIVATLRREQELSGRCAVVRTGPEGLHAWAELREVRRMPRKWFSQEATRIWYLDLGTRILSAARKSGARDGKVDMACCAAGRFARRPGWRVVDDGELFRSEVVTVAASKVRGRSPRWNEIAKHEKK